ncbi:AI-2E family transporter [Sinorhizobium sp. BG8]|uniref:AI-2E family transporter n=1 Tax=Sinorhizobium sp. BG8 TaxID=2613773 RepID=UPI00193CD64A|nr:AI-2E family transporter [Sinorhizobium sp. BG8]QRM56805.1 AI-2E family transporter [Sinorhizobium sp. BG8]
MIGAFRAPGVALISSLSAARWLLVLVIIAGVYFFHGFVVPVLAALVIAFASWPLYSRLLASVNNSRTIAASLAILMILAFIIVPIMFAATYAFHEVRDWIGWAVEMNRSGAPTPLWIKTLPVIGGWLDQQWIRFFDHPGGIGEITQIVSGANIGNIYRVALAAGGAAFHLLLTMLFMLIALFFIYRDGEAFVAQVDRLGERILPTRWERISRVVPATISSTVTGMTLIAIGEGIVLGVAYWIAGVPSAVTLGVLTGLMALFPGGAPVSFTLVSIYLVASGSPFAGVALFLWGSIELFIVDKTLRPKLVGGPIKLPFLPTFFGLIGGVKTMGFLGLFIGPVLMALLVAIWREWMHEVDMAEESPDIRKPDVFPG